MPVGNIPNAKDQKTIAEAQAFVARLHRARPDIKHVTLYPKHYYVLKKYGYSQVGGCSYSVHKT